MDRRVTGSAPLPCLVCLVPLETPST